MFDKQPLKGLRRALALSVAVGLTSLSVMALVAPTSSRADDNTSTSQAQADLSSQEATAAAEKAKAQAEADKKAEEVAKAEADRLAQAEADKKAAELAKAKEAEAQAEANRQKAKEAEAEEAKAAKAEEPATPEVQEPEAEAPAKGVKTAVVAINPSKGDLALSIGVAGKLRMENVSSNVAYGNIIVTIDGIVDPEGGFSLYPGDQTNVNFSSEKCDVHVSVTAKARDQFAEPGTGESVSYSWDVPNSFCGPQTKTVEAKSLDQSCPEGQVTCGAYFVITSISDSDAPASISVKLSDGSTKTVDLFKTPGSAAHYQVEFATGLKVTEASAKVPKSWSGQFNLSHYLCKVKVTPEYKYGTGLYFYKKLDPSKPATWENSGTQQFVDSKEGASDPGWFSSISKLPANVCGPGWAWQQDKQKVSKDKEIVWPATINYPVDNIGWPPIYADKHGEMSDLGITVPNCMTEFTVVVPKYTPGTCFAAGSVEAPATNQNSWMVTGPANARMYTAVPIGDVTLVGQTVFGPYDTTQVPYTDAKCKPVFQVEEKCTPQGGYVKITYTNNSRWDRWPDYSFTGDTKVPTDYGSGPTWNVVKVLSGQTKVIFEKYFAEDYGNGGPISVWFQDILGAERDIDTSKTVVSVETNCRPNIEAPAIEVLAQQCTVGDQGAGVFTGGSITITKPEGVGVATVYDEEDNEVTDLTNVLPGVYTVVVPTSDPNGEFKPLPEGWTYVGEGKNKISTTVTVQAAVDCTILPPPPVKVPGFDGYTDCYGVFARTWDEVQYPVWKDGGWVLADPVVENDTGFVKTRELTNEEWWTLGCYPESPADKVEKKHDEGLSCEGGLKTRDWKLLTTYSWKWSEDVESEFRGEWVANPTVVQNDTGWVKIRNLNASEKKELGCVLPPSLAYTGAGPWALLALAGLVLVVGGLTTTAAFRRRPAGLQG